MNGQSKNRVFKTAWFNKAAKKARIIDADLCEAIQEAFIGQCDDLGGGVYKKRLDRNRHRSIIVAKGKRHWIFVFLFAKKNRANVEPDELQSFRDLAKLYGQKTDEDIAKELAGNELVEICNAKTI